jgi:hypothetical protein
MRHQPMVLEPIARDHREGDRERDELLPDGVVERPETGERNVRVVDIERRHEQGQGEGERRVDEPDRAVELALVARVARRAGRQRRLRRTHWSKAGQSAEPARSRSASRSSIGRILPISVSGSSSVNSARAGVGTEALANETLDFLGGLVAGLGALGEDDQRLDGVGLDLVREATVAGSADRGARDARGLNLERVKAGVFADAGCARASDDKQ